jgi:hypothetical protein
MNDKPRFKSPEVRKLMAFTLALDPTMADGVRKLFRMGVRNIRHDTMLVRQADGSYAQLPDPCAWMGDINQQVGIMLLRSKDGEWWLNGF